MNINGTPKTVIAGYPGLPHAPFQGKYPGAVPNAFTAGAGTYLDATGAWSVPPNTGGGSVTSVAASVPSFLAISGSPITTSGTLAITYSGTALPAANGGTGLTSLAMSGDLTGNYPNPTVAKLSAVGSVTRKLVGYPGGGTVSMDFSLGSYDFITLVFSGGYAVSFAPSGIASKVAGATLTLDIYNGSGNPYTITWNSSWQQINGALPTSLTAGQRFRVEIVSTGTTEGGVTAAYFPTATVSPVTSVTGSGSGISVSPTTGAVVVSNTGVTSIVAGTNVTISSATGAVTVNASGGGSDASVFDVMTYGAKGDNNNHSGAEDTAFSSALAAAITYGTTTGKRWKLRIPAGTYLLTAAVTGTLGSPYSGWSVEGDGSGASVVLWAASSSSHGFAITVINNQSWPPSNSPWKVSGLTLTSYDNNAGTAFSVTIPDPGAFAGQIGAPYIFDDVSFVGSDSGSSQGYWTTCIAVQDPQVLHISRCLVFGTTGISLTDVSPYSGDLDGIWIDKCFFITSGYGITMNGSWQSVIISDGVMVSTGSDCINWTLNTGVGLGGSEDFIIRDTYINNRGGSSWGVNLQGPQRTWIHDCFFDYAGGMAGCVKMDGGLQVKLHDNLFSGGGGSEIGISVGSGSGNTAGIQIHDNEFANMAHDITFGGNAYDAECVNNIYTTGSSNPQMRTPVISISGTRCFTDTPVPYGSLPGASNAPYGWRGFITNGSGSPTWGGTASGSGSSIQPVFSDGTNWRYG